MYLGGYISTGFSGSDCFIFHPFVDPHLALSSQSIFGSALHHAIIVALPDAIKPSRIIVSSAKRSSNSY
jgi:hypothetical protein